MICFTIALRSPQSTNNWEKVEKDFNNTLHSIFNQTDDEFEVYVGCNEIPKLDRAYDNRLQFIIANVPVPKTWEEGCRDRSWKLLLCAKEIKKRHKEHLFFGGVYVFPVDADDYVNKNIAKWCKNHPNENGFKSRTGYKWFQGKKYFVVTEYFGGTMNIMKMYAEDLPDDLPDVSLCFEKETAMKLTKRYPIRWYDIEVERKFAEMGKPLSSLPFRSTVYVLNTGNNISENDPSNHKRDKKRFHPIAFLRKINPFDKQLITRKIRDEFGIKNDA